MPARAALTWWETPRDLAVLSEMRFSFNLSFEVKSSHSSSQHNVVFRSQRPEAQSGPIRWQSKYALSFTQTLPPLDSIVYLATPWQACARGDLHELGTAGFFSKNASLSAKIDDTLCVCNKYPIAVHFVVGMYSDDTKQYEPIFVSPLRVEPGQLATYRPTGRALWWLDRPLVSGSFFDAERNLGMPCSYACDDASPTTGFREIWTTFNMDEGKWSVKERASPA